MNKLQITLAFAAVIAVGSLFMDDESSQQNRLHIRKNHGQVAETIMTLNHLNSPLPWEQN